MYKRFTSMCLLLAVLLSLVIIPAKAVDQPKNANVAQGKTVAFACGGEVVADGDYGVNAIKAGLSVLTDGVNDCPNWWVNNGNPYIALKNSVVSGPYIFSVDLGASYETEQISLYSYARDDWGLTPVDSVTFTISADGNN